MDGAVSVLLALCLLHTTLLVSEPCLGDSISVGSVVDEDKGGKLVHVPRLEIQKISKIFRRKMR